MNPRLRHSHPDPGFRNGPRAPGRMPGSNGVEGGFAGENRSPETGSRAGKGFPVSANAPAPAPDRSEARPHTPAGCAVEAYGVVTVAFEAIAGLRKAPGPLGGRPIPPSLLKHADHQTVLA